MFAEVPVGLLFGCVCVLIGAFIGLLIVSILLRAAVWITNKCLGSSGGSGRRRSSYEDEWDDDYDRPSRRYGSSSSGGIPEPDLFKGMGITLLVGIANIVIGVIIVFAMVAVGGGGGGGFGGGGGNNPFAPQPGVDPAVQILANCCSTILGFLIWAGILTGLLPTSFPRALLVTLFLYLEFFALGIILVIIAFVIGFAGAAGGGGFR